MSLPFCPRGGHRNVPAVRRRRTPPLRCSEKLSARQDEPPARFGHPAQPVQKTGMHPHFPHSEKAPQNE
ncbi:hypothetical protein K350107B32_01300 [Agathobaculum butyriciproducens]